jgi:hypothetical protein
MKNGEGERGVKNYQKLLDVIYGQPLIENAVFGKIIYPSFAKWMDSINIFVFVSVTIIWSKQIEKDKKLNVQ